jgi:hypothetical protein
VLSLARKEQTWKLAELKLDELSGAVTLGAAASKDDEPAAEAARRTPAARLRHALVAAGERAEAVLEPSAVVSVGALALEIARGAESLRVGPGRFELRREGVGAEGWLRVSLQPGAAAGGKERALLFRADVPRGSTAAKEAAVLAVEGGAALACGAGGA